MTILTDGNAVTAQRRTAAAERILTAAQRRRRDLPAPQVLLRSPGWEFASGDRAQPFHAASVAKTMTATLALQLADQGRLDLDAPLGDRVPADLWRGLFDTGNGDPGDTVTPWHLLTHTSGAADYFEDRNDTGTPFPRLLANEPGRRWHPDELLAFTRAHQQPVGAPGERFHYSDTGYVLLGRIIEEVGGAPLGAQLHERILAPADMTSSCLLFHTAPGGGPSPAQPGATLGIAPIVVAGTDLSRAEALSCDWGGGGVVTTLDDLHRFSDAFHDGRLLSADARGRMARFSARFRPGIRYGGGLMQLRYGAFTPFARRLPRTTGHLGVTGVHLFAAPEAGITLAMNFHSTREMLRSFRVHIRLLQQVARGTKMEA